MMFPELMETASGVPGEEGVRNSRLIQGFMDRLKLGQPLDSLVPTATNGMPRSCDNF